LAEWPYMEVKLKRSEYKKCTEKTCINIHFRKLEESSKIRQKLTRPDTNLKILVDYHDKFGIIILKLKRRRERREVQWGIIH
jgi:hypothetical protein